LTFSPARVIGGVAFEIIYGFEFKSASDAFIQDVTVVAAGFKAAGVPGRFWVEILPVLKYVPHWMPGAGFRRWAIEHREASRRALNNPFQEVYEAHVSLSSLSQNQRKACVDNTPLRRSMRPRSVWLLLSLIDFQPATRLNERKQASLPGMR
jgi:hypothetical protein